MMKFNFIGYGQAKRNDMEGDFFRFHTDSTDSTQVESFLNNFEIEGEVFTKANGLVSIDLLPIEALALVKWVKGINA